MTFFSGWQNLLQVIVTGVIAYAGLLVFLRVSGKRTLAKLNAFDLVVTVALGSTLSSMLPPANASLVDGLAALALLVGAQYVIAWGSMRSDRVRRAVKSDPALVFYRGRWMAHVMKRERLSPDEILAAMRSSGAVTEADVEAVVLETNGTVSVVRCGQGREEQSTLREVRCAGDDCGEA